MATEVRLKHEASGMVEKAVIGFSWTIVPFQQINLSYMS